MPARRGTIVDRNGVELAVSEDAVTVFAHPFLIDDPAEVADPAGAAPRAHGERPARGAVATASAGFVYLRRKMDASRGRRGRAARDRGDRHGGRAASAPTRRASSPRRCSASSGTDNKGLSGLEHAREEALGGTDGERRVVKDALGEPVSMVEVKRARGRARTCASRIDAAHPGAHRGGARPRSAQTYTPHGATAVVLDPRTGEVLALANWPRVDANDLDGAPAYARKNRAIQDTYEPGSTFKAITVAGALEENLDRAGHDARGAARDPGGRPHDRARRTTAGAAAFTRGRHPRPARRTSAR